MDIKILVCNRKKDKFHGFHLLPGMVYGIDEQGYFVTNLLLEKNQKHRGGYRTLKMWRLDNASNYSNINVDWHEVWERSKTTLAILQKMNEMGITRFRYGVRTQSLPTNQLAYVRNTKSHVLFT